ncbi:SDR family NAD(P)-dependent oxidoreductase [Bradyrhizobium denitrificans]
MTALSKPLLGKTAIVTGAARGLGLDYAMRLAQLGCNIAICDKSLDSAKEYEQEAARLVDGDLERTLSQSGTGTLLREVDATDELAVRDFIQEVAGAFGTVDVLVCNAGGGGNLGGSAASELTSNDLSAVFARNFNATVYCITAAASYMKAQRFGRIINVSSFMGVMALGKGLGADYATSKAAVAHYTRYLAQDLAPYGITANVIAPGYIATGQFETRLGKADPHRYEAWRSSIPLGRFGKPADCTHVVEFLATSEYVTGQVICVDGGLIRGAS